MNSASPKREVNREEWYPYYAGFSLQFAEGFLEEYAPGSKKVVLDPWGGAGTTCLAAVRQGHRSIGLDINPVLTVIARAQVLLSSGVDPIKAVQGACSSKASNSDSMLKALRNPLSFIRAPRPKGFEAWGNVVGELTPEETIWVAAALATVRSIARPHRGSNPTWNRKGLDEILASTSNVEASLEFAATLAKMRTVTGSQVKHTATSAKNIWGTSENIDLDDSSVDCILTSPPYCTRIDYVVQTRPELQALGATPSRLRRLRDSTTGTPTISKNRINVLCATKDVVELLDKIEKHPSYASTSYYLPFFRQYFSSMGVSVAEIARVIKKGGYAGIVVQPSHYKDLLIDLPGLICSMANDEGLEVHSNQSWKARDMRGINSASRQYASDRVLCEHLIVLRKS